MIFNTMKNRLRDDIHKIIITIYMHGTFHPPYHDAMYWFFKSNLCNQRGVIFRSNMRQTTISFDTIKLNFTKNNPICSGKASGGVAVCPKNAHVLQWLWISQTVGWQRKKGRQRTFAHMHYRHYDTSAKYFRLVAHVSICCRLSLLFEITISTHSAKRVKMKWFELNLNIQLPKCRR